MRRFKFRASVILPVLALVLAAAGGVVAGTQSSDEQALQPARSGAGGDVQRRVDALLAKMTLQEKLEQIQLLPDFMVTEAEVRKGLGSILSVTDPARIRELQRIAVEESRLKIPLLFAFDTIHGFRTIFPIPLAAGASFDPRVASDDHTYGARESAGGRAQADRTRRWSTSRTSRAGAASRRPPGGPVPELGAGGRARQGDPGQRLQQPDKLVASPKHFAAYGQPEAAATTTPPTCPSSGCGTSTCRRSRPRSTPARHVHVLVQRHQRRPGCGNDDTMNQILKGEWGFDGFVESDWTAVAELRACPPEEPRRRAVRARGRRRRPATPRLALNAGVDSEMTSTLIRDFGASCSPRAASRCGGSTTRSAGSCGSSSAPACSSTRTRRQPPTRPRPRC
jgi:beta-glucosidase